MKNGFVMFGKEGFKNAYAKLSGDQGLMSVLAEMQVKAGIPERKAFENANAMIMKVAQRENLENMLSEDAQKTLDLFLTKSNQMSGYDRKVLLHQLYFGLRLYQDPELVDRLQEGASGEDLFREYYARAGEDPAVTEEILEADIRELMAHYRISPKAMRSISRKLRQGRDLLGTSFAIGEEGQRFKCITAMCLYLENKDSMTMDEAVDTACTDLQMEGVADAASCGLITQKRMEKILAVTALASFLIGLTVLFTASGSAAFMDELAWDVTRENAGNIFSNLDYIHVTRSAGVGRAVNEAVVDALVTDRARPDSVVKRVKQVYRFADAAFGVSLITGLVMEKASAWMGRLTAGMKFAHFDKKFLAAQTVEQAADRMEAEAYVQDMSAQTEAPAEGYAKTYGHEEEEAKQVCRIR